MRRLLVTIIITLSVLSYSKAQDYNTGVGIRGAYFGGLTVKHFLESDKAIEGILSTRWKGFSLTGLYEIHNEAFDVSGLNWFYGFGGHIGVWDGKYVYWGREDRNYTVIGIDGIIGLEYSISDIPFSVSVDWNPTINLIGYTGFWGDGGALSIRYVF